MSTLQGKLRTLGETLKVRRGVIETPRVKS